MKRYFRNGLMLTCIFLLILSGCSYTYESGPKSLTEQKNKEYDINPKAEEVLETAIKTTDKTGRKFWFTGWVVNKVQKRRTTSMYDGTFDRDKGYLVNARVLGQSFRYYHSGNDVYVSKGEDEWVKGSPSNKPLDPFNSFRVVLPYAKKAKQLPNQDILGNDCNVFEINLTGSDMGKILDKLDLGQYSTLNNLLLDQTNMRYRIWVGKEDSYIYQLKTEIWMPVPQGGAMYQEVYFRFWDYNSDSISVPDPEHFEEYRKK